MGRSAQREASGSTEIFRGLQAHQTCVWVIHIRLTIHIQQNQCPHQILCHGGMASCESETGGGSRGRTAFGPQAMIFTMICI